LTRQLLAFSRRQPVQRQLLDLNERLKEVRKLLVPLMGDDVDIVHLPKPGNAIIEADPGQIDQVVLNLAVNARDAMPRGGKLILETGVFDFDDAFAHEHPGMSAGAYVMLAISDNGSGMDEATRSRIFEPFFTTKETGKGTGLGLATVYGIIQQNGGHIWVYSELGHGTTFKIYLPSAEKKLIPGLEKAEDVLPPRREGVTVLVVEDDSVMRRLTHKMLEEHGYQVVEAEDGNAALAAIASAEGKIDLTLTDVVMKGMTGPDLVLRLIESYPQMKVVYMSGYTGELVTNQRGNGMRLLEKPFTRASLLQTLDRALNEEG
jgi:two-component system, cell cycle sensor histidine kinase and response regulator CckA